MYIRFTDYTKAFDSVSTTNWKILTEMGIPDHITCLLRNLYAGQEATARPRDGATEWFKIGKGVRQGCKLSPCLFNLNAEHIMRNAELDWMKHKLESILPGEISITSDMQMTPPLWQKAKRNWRASWWKWKRSVKKLAWNPAFQNEDHGIWSHHFMANRCRNSGNSVRLYFGGLQNRCRWWLQPWN